MRSEKGILQAVEPSRALADVQPGEAVVGTYLLCKLELGDAGRARCELRDHSGRLEARWPAEHHDRALLDADAVAVEGRVEGSPEAPVLRVESIAPRALEGPQLTALQPHSPCDPEALFDELIGTLDGVADPQLRAFFHVALSDPSFVEKLKAAPAASSFHHSYRGGLLEHIVSLLRLSLAVSGVYPRLDQDLVLAGAFLHDIGKVEELSYEAELSYTTRGQLLGHIAIGTLYIERWANQIEGFPERLRDELMHLVLSHHGLREHGSPVLPATPEAMVVHFLDNLDGRLWSCYRAIDDPRVAERAWSPYSRHLKQRFFRRQVASRDEGHP